MPRCRFPDEGQGMSPQSGPPVADIPGFDRVAWPTGFQKRPPERGLADLRSRQEDTARLSAKQCLGLVLRLLRQQGLRILRSLGSGSRIRLVRARLQV